MHVLVGPYELFDFRNLSGQAARRGRDIHFPRYHLDRAEERKEFVGALQYLLSHVPLSCEVESLLKEWRWFAEWSIGCVGILRDWLVDTVAALLTEGSSALTIEALQAHALQPGQRVRLEMEARSGEHKVETGNAHSHQQLQELLANPTRFPHLSSEGGTNSASLTAQLPPQKPANPHQKTARGRVIERTPHRDPVGQMESEGKATKCSFVGALDLSPVQMAEASVAKVECPECGAMRTLHPQGETVRFPSHPKRGTHLPHEEVRWIRQGTVWALSEKKT